MAALCRGSANEFAKYSCRPVCVASGSGFRCSSREVEKCCGSQAESHSSLNSRGFVVVSLLVGEDGCDNVRRRPTALNFI